MALGDVAYRGASVWKRLVGNITTTRKFLRQVGDSTNSAAPAWDLVTDADLSTSDITTNNVSITKHGFTPKAPNNTTTFLRGDATWAAPAGGTNALLDGTVHTDTTASAVTKGDLVAGNSTPAWDDLPIGTNGQVLTADSVEAMGMKWATPAGGTNALLDGTSHTDTTNSPVTKGDIVVGNSTPAWDDLPVGTNGQVLTADSAEATGLKWNTPSGGTQHTLLDGSTHTDTTASGVTKGDLVVGNSTPAWDDLAVGTDGQVLTANSAATNGVEWATASGGGDTYVRKTADEGVTDSTTLQNDDHLLFAVDANAVYSFELLLIHGATGSNPDFKLQFTVPASATMLWGGIAAADPNWEPGTAATVPSNLNTAATVVPMGSTTDTAGQRFGSIFRGIAVIAGTSGTVQLQWAQNSLSAVSTSTIYTNSFIKYRKIS